MTKEYVVVRVSIQTLRPDSDYGQTTIVDRFHTKESAEDKIRGILYEESRHWIADIHSYIIEERYTNDREK